MSLILGMAGFAFDASQVKPDEGRVGPVPAGWYAVQVDESEIKATSAGDGAYIGIRMTILQPAEFAGRKIFHNFNIKNKNQQAVDIAYGQLSALSHAVGVINWQDTAQLHGIPFNCRVKVRPAKDGYEAANDVTAFKNINENIGDAGSAAAPGAPSQPMGQPGMPLQPQQPAQQPVQQPQQPQGGYAPQQPAPGGYAPQQQPPANPQPWEQQQGNAQPGYAQPAQPQQPVQPQPGYAPQQSQPVQQPVQQPQQQPAGGAVPPWVGQQQ